MFDVDNRVGSLFLISFICFNSCLTHVVQEVVFHEDGEPIIDGEPGDLKVFHPY